MHADFHFLKVHVIPAHLPRFVEAATGERKEAHEIGAVPCFARSARFHYGKQGFKLFGFRQMKFGRFDAKPFDFARRVFIVADARSFQNVAERA